MPPDQFLSLRLHPDPTDEEAFSGEFRCIPLLPPEGFAASHRRSSCSTGDYHHLSSPPSPTNFSTDEGDFSNLRLLEPPHQRHCIRCRLSPTTTTVSDELLHRLHCFQLYNHMMWMLTLSPKPDMVVLAIEMIECEDGDVGILVNSGEYG
ncbi:unnamed protein product [Lactuca virosa]|uniref:Uncharacterized protein n=1 Tax=Lactuca virosa TaxID=75947 RepID=A0AAU9PPG5_9ASTR|nr:unnamed protein product [Lactuca virosa]